ncbi:MAG: hypothetical protein OHK0040_02520 [bacterium]
MKEGPLDPNKNPLFSDPETIPERYWQSLKEDSYRIDFLGFRCDVLTNQRRIEVEGFPVRLDFQTYLVILHYLNSKKTDLGDEWVLARELKGGIHFFDRSHPLTVKNVLVRINGIAKLKEAFSKLKGREVNFGDYAYELEVFQGIHLRYIYYEGDEEFKPELTVNFQKGIENILPLDVIWAMVNVVNKVLICFLRN